MGIARAFQGIAAFDDEGSNSARTDGRLSTMSVNTPSAVPNGKKRQEIAATTMQNVRRRCWPRLRAESAKHNAIARQARIHNAANAMKNQPTNSTGKGSRFGLDGAGNCPFTRPIPMSR